MLSIIKRCILREVDPQAAAAIGGNLNTAAKAMKTLPKPPAPAPQMPQRPMQGKPGNIQASATKQIGTQADMARKMKPKRIGGAIGKIQRQATPDAQAPGQGMTQSMVLRGILQESKMSRVIDAVMNSGKAGVAQTAKNHHFRATGGRVNGAQQLVRKYMKTNGKHLVSKLPDTAAIHTMKSGRGVNALVATAQSQLLHSMVTRGRLMESFKSKRGKPIVKAGMDAYGRATSGNLTTSALGDAVAAAGAKARGIVKSFPKVDRAVASTAGAAFNRIKNPISGTGGGSAAPAALLSPQRKLTTAI